ncbi:MAG: hypothetical protein HC908_08325 [Calothrix sp. SM1_7_51]|nr:hypothetical protein [Calothrix sp. SM1_7_51]
MRSALVLAAADKEGLNLINVLKNFLLTQFGSVQLRLLPCLVFLHSY